MKTLHLISSIILIVSVSGCATVFENSEGKLRAVTVARNIYKSDCGDCEIFMINTTPSQTGTLSSIVGKIANTVKAIATGILPRGVPAE